MGGIDLTKSFEILKKMGTAQFNSVDNPLEAILRSVKNTSSGQETLRKTLQTCKIQDIEVWCAYILESLSSDLGECFIRALSTEQKRALLPSGEIKLQVALIGEYGVAEWVGVLANDWPEIVEQCLDNALWAFEKHAIEEKKILEIMPGMSQMGLITYIQEKVFKNYLECMTAEHCARYIHANTISGRAPTEELLARHQQTVLLGAIDTRGLPTQALHRRLKI